MKINKATLAAVAALMMLLGAIVVRFTTAGAWSREYIHDDMFQQTPVFFRAQDPGVFPDDLLINYTEYYVPPLYRSFFSTAARFWDPIDVGKFFHFFLLLIAVAGAALIGARSGGTVGALLAGILVGTSLYLHGRLAGGLPRAFGFPFVLAFMAAESWGWRKTAGALALLSAGFYPSVALFLMPTWIVLHRGAIMEFARRKKGFVISVATALFFVGLAVWVMHRPDWIGRPYTLAEASLMPEWSRIGGRFEELPWMANGRPLILISFFKEVILRDIFSAKIFLMSLAVVVLTALFFRGKGRRYPPETALFGTLFIVSAVVFVAACFSAFRLFIPSRVLEYSFLPLMWCGAVVLPASFIREKTGSQKKGGLVALALVFCGFLLTRVWLPPALWYGRIGQDQRELCRYLQTLPKDVLIAGPPSDMDPVPLFSRRKVYVNYETAHPLFNVYYNEISRRLSTLARLYHASDCGPALELVKQEGITHLVLDRRHFEKEGGAPYCFEPHGTAFREARLLAHEKFCFSPGEKWPATFENTRYRVIEVGGK